MEQFSEKKGMSVAFTDFIIEYAIHLRVEHGLSADVIFLRLGNFINRESVREICKAHSPYK